MNNGDVPTDQEAWGFRKTSYMFKDLDEFVRKADGKKEGESGKKRKDGKKAQKSKGKKSNED